MMTLENKFMFCVNYNTKILIKHGTWFLKPIGVNYLKEQHLHLYGLWETYYIFSEVGYNHLKKIDWSETENNV